MAFLNRCIWTAAGSGLGSFVVSAAAQNGYTPALCLGPAVSDGATYHYFATNGTEHEEGDGVYTVATNTLTRATIRNSSTGAKVNFSAAPVVTMGGPTGPDLRIILTADTTFSVATTGSDVTGNGTSGAPWATIQFAYDTIAASYDLANHKATISLAAGTYTAGLVISKAWTGGGSMALVGGAALDRTISTTSAHCITNTACLPGSFFVSGVTLTCATGSVNCISNFNAGGPIVINGNVSFGAAALAHMYTQFYGVIIIAHDYQIDGNAQYHYVVDRGGNINANDAYTVTISGARTFSGQFAHANGISSLGPFQGTTFTLAGGASVTGTRFLSQANSIIITGTSDLHFFPGSAEGSTQTESLYDEVMYGPVALDMVQDPNTLPFGITNYSLTGSGASSFVQLTGTWNTSGTPTAIQLNITNTASNAASRLLDLRVGGVTKTYADVSGNFVIAGTFSIGSTFVGANVNCNRFYADATGAGQLQLNSAGTNYGAVFNVNSDLWALGASANGSSITNKALSWSQNGNVVLGPNAALATNATNGFMYIPTCAGTPTGVPTAYTGAVAMVYDTTNNKLYIYNGGWKGGTTPGAFT